MSDQDREYLRMLYEENAEHARAHEDLRGQATTILIALIAGALLLADKSHPFWIGSLIFALSLLGIIINHKHYERYSFHLERLRGFRAALEQTVTPQLTQIGEMQKNIHNKKYPVTHRVPLHALWLFIYVLTAILGAAIAIGKVP